ncbi:MAG: hypothetical protein AB8H80_17340 [Planctomycetota bacterium]
MTALADLWLPILLSAVFVFVVSSILHMVLPIHRKDYDKLPHEDAICEALRSANVPPGQYMFPGADSMKEAMSPEMQKKFARGPVGILMMRGSGMPNMGKALLQWFAFSLLIGLISGYVAAATLPPGTAYLSVFRITGAVAFAGYALWSVNDTIWKGIPWAVTLRFAFDGTLYALVTAGAFAWLWPAAI